MQHVDSTMAFPAPARERTPRKQSKAAPRPRRRSQAHRRRSMAQDARPLAPPDVRHVLQQFWDEHAVKAGMVGFYAWFTVANWGAVQNAISAATLRLIG